MENKMNPSKSIKLKHFGLLALVVLGLSGCGHQASTMTYHTTGWYTKHLSVAKKLNAKCNQMQSMGTGVLAHDCRNAGIAVLGQPYTE